MTKKKKKTRAKKRTSRWDEEVCGWVGGCLCGLVCVYNAINRMLTNGVFVYIRCNSL